jgi:hypothetical protein
MLIRVKYRDNRFDMVRPETLNRLLDAGNVQEFQRADGWVRVDSGNLRYHNRIKFSGPERRSHLKS